MEIPTQEIQDNLFHYQEMTHVLLVGEPYNDEDVIQAGQVRVYYYKAIYLD